MKKRILKTIISSLLMLSLVGCGQAINNEEEAKVESYPFVSQISIKENTIINLTEDELRSEIEKILNEFSIVSQQAVTREIKFLDIPQSNENIQSYAKHWMEYMDVMGIEFKYSEAGLTFAIEENENNEKSLFYNAAMVVDIRDDNFTYEGNRTAIKIIDWFNEKGLNIDKKYIEDIANENILKIKNNGTSREEETVELDEKGTKLNVTVIKNGEGSYNVGFIVSGPKVKLKE